MWMKVNVDESYSIMFCLHRESLDTVKEAEMRSRICGVSSHMQPFYFSFGVVLGEMILQHGDNLSQTLQGTHLSAAEKQVVKMTIHTLKICYN